MIQFCSAMDVDTQASASTGSSYSYVRYCAFCEEHIEGGRWYSHEGQHALVCEPCLKFIWKDHCKLEEYLDFHSRNVDFPKMLFQELRRVQQSRNRHRQQWIVVHAVQLIRFLFYRTVPFSSEAASVLASSFAIANFFWIHFLFDMSHQVSNLKNTYCQMLIPLL